MFRNYLKTAWRSIRRNKIFSGINVLGLAVGISAALVIFMIVAYEFSFDRFQKDRDRIYRVVLSAEFGGGTQGFSAGIPAPLGGAVASDIAAVTQTVPVFQFQGDATADVGVDNDNTGKPEIFKKQKNIIFTNAEYTELLGYQWIAGNAALALKEPFSVVLTESRAQLYFPGLPVHSVVGKQLRYNDVTATVSGIVKDLDQPTDFKAREFISLPTISATSLRDNFMMDVWDDWMAYTQLYVKISRGYTPEQATTAINALFKQHYDPVKKAGNKITLILQPLSDIHFNGQFQSFDSRIASRSTLYGLLAVAGFLLFLGCINFINLSTARSSQRAKEIGIRKTIGSSRMQLILQVLCETFLVTLMAVFLSVLLTPWVLQLFADYIPEGLTAGFLFRPGVLLFLSLLTLVITLAAGIYPALILCGYRPALVLKNVVMVSGGSRHARVRKILTVSQFVIAQFFVIATMLVAKQIRYSVTADMGFNKDAVIKFNIPRDSLDAHRAVLINKIKAIPGVQSVSSGFFSPADQGAAFVNVSFNNGAEEIRPQAQIRWGDPEYLKVYDLKLVAGRNVSADDSVKEFLVNESFAREMGFQQPQQALGKYLRWNDKELVPVVGVMKDFHDMSLKSRISPMVFENGTGATFHVRFTRGNAGGSWAAAISRLQRTYGELYPGEPFKYAFVDEMVADFYKSERATEGLLTWATGLTILISCLGLLGLVVHTTNSRTREIGVRKVLGAPVKQIVALLSKEFIVLVVLAFLIAAPVAWWAGHKWLENYAYKTTMNWWVFVFSGMLMLVFAVLTLSIKTVQAATANPVKALRSE
ncbi:ABC transporter permease [Niabella beijingensis]|uniref:ABC transporter permease n=1 Tax=Niabella beijingensis TaxID=2872700 RepID=UPI001CBDAB75|nr:ABC transporter permease [Niabella beijingensis]MBZ4191477.1 ABC transporter permease [Niabella beijingensis]